MLRPNSFPLALRTQDDSAGRSTANSAVTSRRAWLGAVGVFAVATAPALGAETCLAMTYAPKSATVGVYAYGIVSADLDADGDVDVLVPEANSNSIRILANLGNDSFATTMIGVGGSPQSLGLGDADHDGDTDVLVAMATSMRVLFNTGGGLFALGPGYSYPSGGNSPATAFLRDVNGDGTVDAIVALESVSIGAAGGVVVGFGDGSGALTLLPAQALPVPAGRAELADFDGDGRLDLAVLGGNVTWNTIALSFGVGDGTFVNSPTLLSAGLYAGAFGSGDLDGDGDVDLVRGNKYWLTVLWNDGAGAFTAGANMNIGSYGKGVAVGDVDHDGDLDLAATSGGGAAIRILANDGAGAFTPTHVLGASVQCYAVLLADTNGDGYLDPWAVDYSTGQLFRGSSHCIAARYGQAKMNSLGCLPTMGILGTPSVASTNFAITTNHELESQPALVLFGLAAADFTALGGHVLVAPPWTIVATTTSVGSGNPFVCDGRIEFAIPAASLALAPLGTRVFVQVLAADPFQADGTMASLSDGLHFQISP